MEIVFRDDVRRFFLDTEFIEDGHTIDLISIAVVSEDPTGPEFYAANAEANLSRANPWVREHVLPLLPADGDSRWMSRSRIRDGLIRYLHVGDGFYRQVYPDVEIHGYYADYDWVVICQLFGMMVDLPRGMPKFCMDIKQLAVMLGNPRLPTQADGQHNALADARWNREAFAFLRDYARTSPARRAAGIANSIGATPPR